VKKTIVYVVSTNYAGSHYLSLMLGSHSRAAYLGEIRQYTLGKTDERVCYRCKDTTRCPLFRDVDAHDIPQIYEGLSRNLRDSADVLIDNSKLVSWARNFVGDDRYHKRYVHVIRDPRALARRWDLRHPRGRRRLKQRWGTLRRNPLAFLPILFGGRTGLYAHKWLNTNRGITRFLSGYDLEHIMVTYQDLARDPEGEIRRLMDWLRLPFEPEQLNYWNFEHHGTQKKGYEWIGGQQKRYFDMRWKEHLTPAEQEWLATYPPVTAYAQSLRLTLTDDGLTRKGRRSQP